MVHGTTYTVRYLLKLKNPIDYYDDLLPICMANRKMFELLDDKTIVVLGEKDLGKRFDNNPLARQFYEAISNIEYSGSKTKEEREFDDKNRKYFHALIYSSELKIINKSNYDTTKIYSLEELNAMKQRHNEINKIFYSNNKLTDKEDKELMEEMGKIGKNLRYGPIFCPETSQEIIDIERELTDIELTEEEKQLIERVKSMLLVKSAETDLTAEPTEPTESNVEAEGFQLFSYFW